MSDQSGLGITFDDSLNLDEIRQAFESFMGAARRRTILVVTGAGTLTGNADEIWADMTAGAFAYALPSSPNDGDSYVFTKTDATGNALTIGRNAKNINGAAADATLSTQWGSKTLTWSATANTWWSR